MDLLSPSSKPLKINEDPSKGVVVVAGLTEMVRESFCIRWRLLLRCHYSGCCAQLGGLLPSHLFCRFGSEMYHLEDSY